jgi:hypothetical protein
MKQSFKTTAMLAAAVAYYCAMPLSAQHRGSATTLFDFVNISYDAQAVALSGAGAALPNGCYGIFSNPAALGYCTSMQAAVGYRPRSGGIHGAPLAYALPQKNTGVWGVGVYGLTSGNINAVVEGPDGAPLFTGDAVRADFLAGNLSWARVMSEYLAVGVTFKGLYTYLKGVGEHWSADGFAGDAGVQCRFMNGRLIYGIVVRNLGLLRSGFEKSDDYPLPTSLQMGLSYVPRYIENMRVMVDINKTRNDYLTIKPAGELEIIKDQMVIRAGYSFSWRDLQSFKKMLSGEPEENYYKSNMVGLCLGAGFRTEVAQRKIQVDAAAEFLTIPVLPALVISVQTDL